MLCVDQIETSTSPPGASLRHLTSFRAQGVGNLTGKAFPGGEEFDLGLGVVGKIEPEV